MITVITNPSDHNFSKSPVICELETDNMFTSGDFGDHAEFVFYIPANPALNDEFVVKITTGQFLIYIFTTFHPLKYPLPLRAGGLSDIQYYNQILNALTLSTFNTQFFITYIGGGGFKFTARLPGNAYSDGGSGINTGVGFSFSNLVIGTNNFLTNVPRPNYKLAIDVWVDKVSFIGPMELVFSAEKEPVNNRVRFEIDRMLDIQLDYYFPIPNLNVGVFCDQTCKRFYVNLREIYGSPATDQLTYAQPNSALASPGLPTTYSSHILKAGFAPRWNKLQPIQQLSAYIWSYPLNLTTKSFRNIKINQPEYLYFCFPSHIAFPRLKITTYYADGTSAIAYQSSYNDDIFEGCVVCFPINFSGSIIYYEMLNGDAIRFEAVVVGAVDLSAPIVCYPVYEPMGDNRVFLFTNSMGGVDTMRTEGDYEHDIEIESVTSSRNYYTSDHAHLGSYVETDQKKTDIFTAFTGWIDKKDVDWYEDFFLAKYKVEVIDTIFYMPILILSKGYKRHKTDLNLVGIEFQYKHQLTSPVTDRLAATL